MGRYTGEDADEHSGYAEELDNVAREIQAGRPVQYDDKEIERLNEELRLFRSVPRSAVWCALGRLFSPAIALVAIIWLSTVLLRWLLHLR
jgi:hypothetical protein